MAEPRIDLSSLSDHERAELAAVTRQVLEELPARPEPLDTGLRARFEIAAGYLGASGSGRVVGEQAERSR